MCLRGFWGEDLRRQALSLGLWIRTEQRKNTRMGKRNNWKEKRKKIKETISKWEIRFSEKEEGWMKTWNWQSFELPGTLSLVLTQAYDETGTPCLCGPPNPGISFKGGWLVLGEGPRAGAASDGHLFYPISLFCLSPKQFGVQSTFLADWCGLRINMVRAPGERCGWVPESQMLFGLRLAHGINALESVNGALW